MPVVVDASVTACWALQDEDDPRATAALHRFADDSGLVPALWWFEIRNILLVAERRGRISPTSSAAFLSKLAQLPITIDRQPNEADLLRLARQHRLTAYDAAYLELAQRASVPLATLDADLARAAHAEHVPLLGPTG
jgi:predicted nucleic acid-binding protein